MSSNLLIEAARTFASRINDHNAYALLAAGQAPELLFISCSDSRVMPSVITDAEPGQLFELRTAGAIVPAYSPDHPCGVAATIEFAVLELGIRDIVVCGHSHCGAVRGLMSPVTITAPAVGRWLSQPHLGPIPVIDIDAELREAGQWHVINQLGTLRMHPAVTGLLEAGEISLYGWFYEVHTGHISQYSPVRGEFQPL
ncbi:carbonic anhydrase [Amycolatopsis sp. NPDC003861]